MDRTVARNNFQNCLRMPRALADYFAGELTEEEAIALSGSALPADATIRGIAAAVLDRLRQSIAPQA